MAWGFFPFKSKFLETGYDSMSLSFHFNIKSIHFQILWLWKEKLEYVTQVNFKSSKASWNKKAKLFFFINLGRRCLIKWEFSCLAILQGLNDWTMMSREVYGRPGNTGYTSWCSACHLYVFITRTHLFLIICTSFHNTVTNQEHSLLCGDFWIKVLKWCVVNVVRNPFLQLIE